MSTLIPSELIKTNNKTQEKRTHILIKAMLDNCTLPFVGLDIESGTIKLDGAVINNLLKFSQEKGAIPLETDCGTLLTTSNIKKTPMFGGGGKGTSLGTIGTFIMEARHALLMQMMIEDEYDDVLTKDIEYYRNNTALQEIAYGNLQMDLSYKDAMKTAIFDNDCYQAEKHFLSAYHTAKYLIKEGYIKKGRHNIHMLNSPIVKQIYASQNQISNARWNPSDIWVINKIFGNADLKILKDKPIEDVNHFMIDCYNRNVCFGVSLKILTHNNPTSKVYNSVRRQDKHYEISDMVAHSSVNDFWNTKTCYIRLAEDNLKIEIRGDGQNKPIRYEISNNQKALNRDGGSNYTTIRKYIKKHFNKSLIDYPLAKSIVNRMLVKRDKRALEYIFSIMSSVCPSIDKQSFKDNIYNKDADWITTKLLGCGVLYQCMFKGNKKTCSNFVLDLIRYGSSQTEKSSIYLKINDEKGDNVQ